eukprot:3061643-Rhodomonas_salina.1
MVRLTASLSPSHLNSPFLPYFPFSSLLPPNRGCVLAVTGVSVLFTVLQMDAGPIAAQVCELLAVSESDAG